MGYFSNNKKYIGGLFEMTLKKEIEDILHPENKMLEISLERLHPPMAPKPIASETTVGGNAALSISQVAVREAPLKTASKLAIDYHRIADLATFERFLIEAIKIIIPGFQGVSTRVSKKKMTTVFNERVVANYGSVVKEFEAKVAKLKEKKEKDNEKKKD